MPNYARVGAYMRALCVCARAKAYPGLWAHIKFFEKKRGDLKKNAPGMKSDLPCNNLLQDRGGSMQNQNLNFAINIDFAK